MKAKLTKPQRDAVRWWADERERRLHGTVEEWWSVIGPAMVERLQRHMYLFSHGKITIDGNQPA